VLRWRPMWRGDIEKELCWWCVRWWKDIQIVHRSIRDHLRVADEVNKKRGCLLLEDFLFFSVYLFSYIAQQVQLSTSSDSCLALIPTIWSSKRLILITISHHCYQYHLRPTLPVTLALVFYNVPDIECIVDPVWHFVLIMFGITVKIPTVISWSAVCAAAISYNWMCLHQSNGCWYCHEPCCVSCWVYLRPNHQWIDVCDDCVDELRRLTGFDISQFPHRSPYSNVRVCQQLYFLNELIWSCWNSVCDFRTRTFEWFWYHHSCTCSGLWGRTFGILLLQSDVPSPWNIYCTEAAAYGGGLVPDDQVVENSLSQYWGAHAWFVCDHEEPCVREEQNSSGTHSTKGHAPAAADTTKSAPVPQIAIEPLTPTPFEIDTYSWHW